jgi:hypothetical protein
MLRPKIQAPTLSKPRAMKSSSTPAVPPSLPKDPLDRARGEGPLVQVHAADAEGVGEVLAGAGAVAVEGDGEGVDAKLGHRGASDCTTQPVRIWMEPM